MEGFSQSRGDDDLFDDEIVPIPHAQQEIEKPSPAQEAPVSPEAILRTTSAGQPTTATSHSSPRGRGRGATRGRGRGRGGQNGTQRSGGGLGDSIYASRPASNQYQHSSPRAKQKPVISEVDDSQPVTESAPTAATGAAIDGSKTAKPSDETSPNTALGGESGAGSSAAATSTGTPSTIPTGPSQPAKAPAVRGDRTQTGGIRKPKLTEEELSAKMAAAKERSQNVAAAHARAQADAELFAERERIAQEKRQHEAQERRALAMDRENNRMRKLKAVGGREWDVEKNEEDFRAPKYGDRTRRGPPPTNEDQDLSMYEWHEDRGRGRGRGGRGRGYGRGRGRGGRGNFGSRDDGGSDSTGTPNQMRPDGLTEVEFPPLPGKTGKGGDTAWESEGRDQDTVKSPKPSTRTTSDLAPAGGSWADQVESSEANAKA